MTESGTKLYTAAQVRGIDYAAINELGIAAYDLMRRAGKAAFDDMRTLYPHARHWLVICGGGNNGGDGYVVARLAAEAGLKLTLCALVDPGKLKGDAALAFADWHKTGGHIETWPLPEDSVYDLAVDALLGTGIDRDVDGVFKQAIIFLNQLPCPGYAIDIPSGLNADTGVVMGVAMMAQNTMTFVGQKRGMYTADGQDHCGHIAFDGLAIPSSAAEDFIDNSGQLLSLNFLPALLSPRLRNTHKGSFGHLFAVGGIKGMNGAIRLCGEAALRSGAGRVSLATDAAHSEMVNLTRPELMVKTIGRAADLEYVISDAEVVAVGPGLGLGDWSASLMQVCLESEAALVVDADALTLLAERSLESPVTRKNWILTPHPAEAARLLNCKVSDIQQDRIYSATTIAQQYGACVVLKGSGTVVADPSGAYSICALGNPGMATAGSGDVLTGIIAALLAQGLTCLDAAKAGVVAHAAAGDLAADKLGEMALIASDIINHLPAVWKTSQA